MMGRLRRLADALLRLEDTPHRVALAFGIGLFIAFSPFLGFQTVIALAVGFLTRLSRAALLIGAYFTNPWTLAPLYGAGLVLGCWLMGIPVEGATSTWTAFTEGARAELWRTLGVYVRPFLLGNLLLGSVSALIGYVTLRGALERRRALKAQPSGGLAS
jgi:uncharacterized protein (DUF2062 family)